MILRQEEKRDYKEVYELIKESFKGAEHTDGKEQDLVVALRKGEAFIPELSLVAEEDGKLIGYILLTKLKVGDEILLGLAPVAVLPEYQNKGIGGKLIEEGHRIGKELGYKGSIVLGYPKYYSKFGYRKSTEFRISSPFEVPEDFFMMVELDEESLKGIKGAVEYPKEFMG